MADKKGTSSSPSVAILIAILVVAVSYWFLPAPSTPGVNVESGFRKDPPTGFSFPETQNFVAAGKKLKILGVGTRKKAIINVYSVAFYGTKPTVKALSTAEEGKKCEVLLTSKGPKAAQLTMNMGLNAEKMAEALSNIEGVQKATKEAFGEMILNGIGGKLKKGESMTLEWKPPESVFVTARGSKIGEMKDKNLFQGLLKVYLGPKSVSPALKKDIETYAAAQ